MRRACRLAFAFALVVGAPLARADEPPTPASREDRAKELKRLGDQAMDSGRPNEALTAYSEAYRISADPVLLYNRGRALQALGEYPDALAEVEKFDQTAPADLKARVPGLAKLVTELRGKVATLTLTCNVAGARIRLRDRSLGSCPPPGPLHVNAGRGTLEIEAEGHFPYKRDVDLAGGGTTSIDVVLVSKATSGVLQVKSPVTGTTVSVDGAAAGVVPVEVTLQAGTHQIELSHDGYKAARTSTIVAAGERKVVEVPLEAEAPITAKWWFWTTIGVVVAGGVVLTYAAVTEKSPAKGTIDPGVVTAGLRF